MYHLHYLCHVCQEFSIYSSLQWRHNERDGIANHQRPDCLRKRLSMRRSKKSSASLAFVRGIHRWPVNSPHKGPVTRKMFPFDDGIMLHHDWLPARWDASLSWWPPANYKYCVFVLFLFVFSQMHFVEIKLPTYLPPNCMHHTNQRMTHI